VEIEIKTDSIVTPDESDAINELMQPFVPPIGSVVELGGFQYRVHKITKKDLILRPVGISEASR